jgi:hypothetical protein
MEIEFQAVENLTLENSFGVIKEEAEVVLHVTLGFHSEESGWFELYDEETVGNDWYAEGGLWFKGKELIEYDGVFSLPSAILDKLKELGYDVSYAE